MIFRAPATEIFTAPSLHPSSFMPFILSLSIFSPLPSSFPSHPFRSTILSLIQNVLIFLSPSFFSFLLHPPFALISFYSSFSYFFPHFILPFLLSPLFHPFRLPSLPPPLNIRPILHLLLLTSFQTPRLPVHLITPIPPSLPSSSLIRVSLSLNMFPSFPQSHYAYTHTAKRHVPSPMALTSRPFCQIYVTHLSFVPHLSCQGNDERGSSTTNFRQFCYLCTCLLLLLQRLPVNLMSSCDIQERSCCLDGYRPLLLLA